MSKLGRVVRRQYDVVERGKFAQERQKASLPPPREASTFISEQELRGSQEVHVQFAQLLALATRMSAEIGLGDHKYPVFRTYTNCFVGRRAVAWMLRKRLVNSEKAALVVGNLMLQCGLIHHVTLQHAFENKRLYYR